MNAHSLTIGRDRTIGAGQPALLVAEIGQNHNGSLSWAEQLIDAAAWAGADAVKVVKRDLQWELSDEAHRRAYESPHAFGPTYGEHRRALELSADDHAALARRASRHGLIYLATASDPPSVDLMCSLGIDALKIASRDLANLPLIDYVAQTGLPLLLSTGMSSLEEIDAAVEIVRARAAAHVLLHCTSLYPTPVDEVHLRSMQTLAERYQTLVGLSDHSPDTSIAPVAVALGAAVVEKHLTLDRRAKGTDHGCSLEPEAFRQLVASVRHVERALGRADKPVPAAVATVRAKLGRSLVCCDDVPVGAMLEESQLRLKCPGDGLSWHDRRLVLGRRLQRPVQANQKLTLEDFQ